MKYIIIGNSAAAVGTVEGIRSVDAEGEIELFGGEPLEKARGRIGSLIEAPAFDFVFAVRKNRFG